MRARIPPQTPALCVLAFFAMLSYALARPPIESLFLETIGSEYLPRAWLLGVIATIGVVAIYQRVSTGVNLVALCGHAALVSALIAIACFTALSAELPFAVYALFVWKEVYIVVIVELFWSIANATHPVATARWVYSAYLVAGSLGGMLGNAAQGPLAVQFGTLAVAKLAVPTLLSVYFGCILAARRASATPKPSDGAGRSGFFASLALVRRSRYLHLLVALVAVVQISIALIDYRFNGVLKSTFTDLDTRTAILGRVYAINDFGALLLQLISAPLVIMLGVRALLILIPAAVFTAFAVAAVSPTFYAFAVLKVIIKCLDYSLLRAVKEILYIPLAPDEKVQGKAIVDMFTYRAAKGGIAAVLVIVVIGAESALTLVLVGAALVAWIAIAWAIARRVTLPAE